MAEIEQGHSAGGATPTTSTTNPTTAAPATAIHQTEESTQEAQLYSTGDVPSGPQADHYSSTSQSDDDSAIGSFRSTKSESLTPSIYQFRYDNGRRFHAPRGNAEYHLPNDEKEMDRLDLQHHLCKLTLGGSLHRAPIGDGVQHVLDIGTGTGIWAIDFAEQYLSAEVIGIDLSPIQPEAIPRNCQFYVDDFEKEWMFQSEMFDYVHARMLVAAVKDWPGLFAKAYKALRPGGWFELQDFYFPIRCDDGSAAPDSPLMSLTRQLVDGARRAGIHLDITNKLPQMIRDAGFVDVHVEWYAWPSNRWPKNPKLKEIGMWAHLDMQDGLEAISLNIFTKVLGWAKEDLDAFLEKARAQLKDRKSHCYAPIGVFYGRKPNADPE